MHVRIALVVYGADRFVLRRVETGSGQSIYPVKWVRVMWVARKSGFVIISNIAVIKILVTILLESIDLLSIIV